jgi:hypothetical protein
VALLLFYEQNNLSAFKRIFLDQVAFAVREYFCFCIFYKHRDCASLLEKA